MINILTNRTYRHLFLAQVISLIGTGLGTVALGLLAYDLAGEHAGAVLGTAFAIKMVAYVGVAPIAGAFADVLPRKTMLIALDVVRFVVAGFLPFVSEIWQVYLLIFILQSASAIFTPTFQATIPDVLPDEQDYTKALSLSRLAYDLENLASPAIAGLLLTFMTFHNLFAGTAIGFLISAAFVVITTLPKSKQGKRRGIYDRTTRGMRIYISTPRLRGLLSVNMAVAAAGAMVIVNTVVFVQAQFGLSETETAFALAAFGSGSMIAALLLPSILDKYSDRPVMLAGSVLLVAGTALSAIIANYEQLLLIWFALGCGYSLALTPSGKLLRRSVHEADRPAIFAAQFALSHACWLITYPLAGWLGSMFGLSLVSFILASLAVFGFVSAIALWPSEDPDVIEHVHPELSPDHPHLAKGEILPDHRHAHPYVIDDLHFMWPHGR